MIWRRKGSSMSVPDVSGFWYKEELARWKAYRAHDNCPQCSSFRHRCSERKRLFALWQEASILEATEFQLLNGPL